MIEWNEAHRFTAAEESLDIDPHEIVAHVRHLLKCVEQTPFDHEFAGKVYVGFLLATAFPALERLGICDEHEKYRIQRPDVDGVCAALKKIATLQKRYPGPTNYN